MIAAIARRAKQVLCFVFVTTSLLAPTALAQIRTSLPAAEPRESSDRQEQQEQLDRSGIVALEGRINASEYEVGPGDVFMISLGGPVPAVYTRPVTPEGFLVLPEAGSVPVSGLSLAEARTRALNAVEGRFRNVQVEISLFQPRSFLVHVSGAVPDRGRRQVTAVTRLSDLISAVFPNPDDYQNRNDTPILDVFRPSLRSVNIKRSDGTTLSVDVARYLATGDVRHNPYLRDGDVITVPAFNPLREGIYVDGNVPFGGRYAYREGDTVLDLVRLAAGSEDLSSVGEVRLTRNEEDSAPGEQILNVQEILAGRAEPVQIRPLDHLYVIPLQRARGTATVEGMVVYPGTYPIQTGRTTLRDFVLNQAGGLRPEALPRGALLLKAADSTRSLRADTTAIARRTRTADLDYPSRSYLQQELRLKDFVPVDLTQVLTEPAAPIYLHHGDRLIVPRDERSVFVFGQVNRTGYVPFVPERSVAEYIAAAGGRTNQSTQPWVIKVGTNQFQNADRAVLESGDAIFVDGSNVADSPLVQQLRLQEESLALARATARQNSRAQIFGTILQVAGLVASTYTTYLLIRD